MKIIYICASIVMSIALCIFLSGCFKNKLGDHSKSKIEKIVAKECPVGCTVDVVVNFGSTFELAIHSTDPLLTENEDVTQTLRNTHSFPPPPGSVYVIPSMARSTWRWYSIVHTDYQILFFFDKDKRLISTHVDPCFTGP